MTEKRFRLGYVCGDYGLLIGNEEWIDFHSMSENSEKNVQICINKMNELADENEELKSEIEKLSYANEDLLSEKRNWQRMSDEYCKLSEENEQLKQQINDMSRFEHTGEHIRLSINIETGELQRHIYATGQWFGDFDRVLCENWINKEDYQRFIDRVIEVYNTEFKGDLND